MLQEKHLGLFFKIIHFYIDNTNAESWGRKGRIANLELTPLMQALMIKRRKFNYKVKYLRNASKDNIEVDVLSETYLNFIHFQGKKFSVRKLRPKVVRKLIADLLSHLPLNNRRTKEVHGSYI